MKATKPTPVVRMDTDSRVSSLQPVRQSSWQPVRQMTGTPRLEHNLVAGGATASAAAASPYCVTISPDMLPDAERRHEAALLLQEGLSLTISEAHMFVAGHASVVVTLDSIGHQLLEALLQSLGLHFEVARM